MSSGRIGRPKSGRPRRPWPSLSWSASPRSCARGLTVAIGRFGAHMLVELLNYGPVTIVLTDEPGA